MHNHIIKIKLLQVCIQCSAVPYCDVSPGPGVSILLRNSLTLKNLIVVVGYNLPECEVNAMCGAQKFFWGSQWAKNHGNSQGCYF